MEYKDHLFLLEEKSFSFHSRGMAEQMDEEIGVVKIVMV